MPNRIARMGVDLRNVDKASAAQTTPHFPNTVARDLVATGTYSLARQDYRCHDLDRRAVKRSSRCPKQNTFDMCCGGHTQCIPARAHQLLGYVEHIGAGSSSVDLAGMG
ncbi:MAG TPA: hypothetical protein VGO33_02840 [Gemmatimonadaceae bacterium]|nr:hypothetical protein [Gemmatimonadaceae bacterium]